MKFKRFMLVLVILILPSICIQAQVPKMINYQGKLTTPQGALIDSTISMTFSIYADSLGMPPSLWSETQASVVIQKGIFSVLLGSINPIPDSVFSGDIRYLGVKAGNDPEMTPRKPMLSVPYAHKSLEADTAHYAFAGPGVTNRAWTFHISGGGDTTYIILGGPWGIARYGNTLYPSESTDVNLGVSSTTGNPLGSSVYHTIGGGYGNVSGPLSYTTVAGGDANIASNVHSAVLGGHNNLASGYAASVAGGFNNISSGWYTFVGGGTDNIASGTGATVPGGDFNQATGDYSFATGLSVRVPAEYTFAFGNDFTTSTPHAVIFYDAETETKVGIQTTSPTARLDVNSSTGYNQIRMRTSFTPTGTADTLGSVGDIAWDNNYFYIKTSAGWKRVALSTW